MLVSPVLTLTVTVPLMLPTPIPPALMTIWSLPVDKASYFILPPEMVTVPPALMSKVNVPVVPSVPGAIVPWFVGIRSNNRAGAGDGLPYSRGISPTTRRSGGDIQRGPRGDAYYRGIGNRPRSESCRVPALIVVGPV